MTLKLITALIPPLFLSSSLQAESTKGNSASSQGTPILQEDISRSTLNQLQDLHNFESIFDDYTFGGMPYESFE